MKTHFHLFVYGTLRGGGEVLDGCTRVGAASVPGMLYRADDRYPALLLHGDAPVRGEVWSCPVEVLPRLDAWEGIAQGLFRRVGVTIEGLGCWAYVAGPALARRLTPQSRIPSGEWSGD